MRKLPAIIVWAVAFAYVESALVEYLRALYYPLQGGGFAFPLLTLEQLTAMGDEHVRRLGIEFGREIATLVMLASIGAAAGRNFREFVAHFMIAFGVWDIFYYIWLKVFLAWPESLMAWDLLFLLPVPWVSPVMAPIIVSVVMIAAGVAVLFLESRGHELKTAARHWILPTLGGLIVIVSFCWDFRNIMAGGAPNPFNWSLFFAGLGIAALGFFVILRRNLVGSR